MNEQQQEIFDADFDAFTENGFPYLAKSESGKWSAIEAVEQLRKYTLLYVERYSANRSSRAAFEIVTKSMLDNGDLRPLRQAATEPAQEPLTVEQYRSMPVRQIQIKYQGDPWFKGEVDRLIAEGRI